MTFISLFQAHLNLSGLIWSIGSRMGSTVLSFLVLFAVSHVLETKDYGLYVFLFSVGSSLGTILVFGQQILLLKHYRVTNYRNNTGNKDLLFANTLWLLAGSSLQVLAAILTFAFRDQIPPPYNALSIAFLFGAVFTFSEYLQSYFRIHGNIALALMPRENIWRILSATLIPAFAWLGILSGGDDAMGLIVLLLALLTGYQFLRFFQMERTEFLRCTPSDIPKGKLRTWNRESFFFTSHGFFAAAANYLETILIGVLLNLEAAAFYFVAYRISMLLTLPVLVADTIGEPHIAARFQDNDRTEAQRLVSLLSAGSFLCALVGGVFLYFAGPFILGQFDASFEQNSDILMILCIGSIAHAFFGPGTSLNMIGGGERHLLTQRSLVFLVYLAALLGLSYMFGLAGVAWASVLQLIVVHLIARNWVLKTWGIDNMATSFFGVARRIHSDTAPPIPKANRPNDAIS